jgi:hypothetical protein
MPQVDMQHRSGSHRCDRLRARDDSAGVIPLAGLDGGIGKEHHASVPLPLMEARIGRVEQASHLPVGGGVVADGQQRRQPACSRVRNEQRASGNEC